MRIAAEQQVAAPPEAVWARLADFEMFEARARRRGVPVERLADDPPAWRIGVDWRGLRQEVELRVRSVSPPDGYVAGVATKAVSGDVVVRIEPRADGSRLSVAVNADADGFAGRVMMSSLGFARPMLESRLQAALAQLATEIEARGGAG